MVVAGPDVYSYHKEDTERYILANLNIVSGSVFGILALLLCRAFLFASQGMKFPKLPCLELHELKKILEHLKAT